MKRKSQAMNTIRPKFQVGGDVDAHGGDHYDNTEEEIVELPLYNPVIYSRQGRRIDGSYIEITLDR